MFDPYLLGCLVNFAYSCDEEGIFEVDDTYSSLQHLYYVFERYQNELSKLGVEFNCELNNGFPNYFKCVDGHSIRNYPLFPYEAESDNWKYLTGLFDMCSTVEMKSDHLILTFNSSSSKIIRHVYEFIQIPGWLNEKSIVYDSTNVLDLFGKLVGSFKQKNLNYIIQGKYTLDVCRVFRQDPEAIMPKKARLSDVGYDVSIIRKYKDLTSNTALYDTGFVMYIPFKYYAEVYPRSSLSKSGYALANSVGIIDPGYRGKIYIALTKTDPEAKPIEFPFRCCQLVFKKQEFIELKESRIFIETESTRGGGGFGSTN